MRANALIYFIVALSLSVGRSKVKWGKMGGMHLSPFKRFLNPVPFKRKAKKIRCRTKMR